MYILTTKNTFQLFYPGQDKHFKYGGDIVLYLQAFQPIDQKSHEEPRPNGKWSQPSYSRDSPCHGNTLKAWYLLDKKYWFYWYPCTMRLSPYSVRFDKRLHGNKTSPLVYLNMFLIKTGEFLNLLVSPSKRKQRKKLGLLFTLVCNKNAFFKTAYQKYR